MNSCSPTWLQIRLGTTLACTGPVECGADTLLNVKMTDRETTMYVGVVRLLVDG